MSYYTMAFMGMAPFGRLLAGALAAHIGAPATLIFGGAACVLGAALFATRLEQIREHVRPIYRQLGILPDVTERAIQDATLARNRAQE
jgi:hypothetical protein